MKIQVNISDEAELKKEIKILVEGYIRQVAREDASALFDAELRRSLEAKVTGISEYTMRDHIQSVLRQAIDKTLGGGWYNQAYVKEEADKYVRRTAEHELGKVKFAETAEKVIHEIASKIKDDFLKKLLDK